MQIGQGESLVHFLCPALPTRPSQAVVVVKSGQDGLSQTLYLQKWPKSAFDTDIQLKTFIHGMEVFNRKIIMRRDSVILSKSRNRLRQRRNLSDERIESENSMKSPEDAKQDSTASCHAVLWG